MTKDKGLTYGRISAVGKSGDSCTGGNGPSKDHKTNILFWKWLPFHWLLLLCVSLTTVAEWATDTFLLHHETVLCVKKKVTGETDILPCDQNRNYIKGHPRANSTARQSILTWIRMSKMVKFRRRRKCSLALTVKSWWCFHEYLGRYLVCFSLS